MHFAKECVLCLIGIWILETVFVHGINIKPAFKAALRETADSKTHGKLHPFEKFDVDHRLAVHRRLLAPISSDVCKWDASRNACSRDALGMSRLMSNSKDTFVTYMANYFLCGGIDDKESCVSEDQCLWNSVAGSCAFVNFAYGNEDSPCVKVAPATFDEYEANVICQQQTSSTTCAAIDNCRWTSRGTCIADEFKIFFDISAEVFLDEDEEITDSKFDEVLDLLFEEFDVQSADFEWSDLLDWDVPDTSCPRSATPTVCTYSNAWVKVFIPVTTYCLQTYESQPSSCNKDLRCSYSNTRDSCGPSLDTRRLAHARAMIAAAKTLTNEADGDILSAYYNCTSQTRQSDCKGACQWRASSGTCSLSQAYESEIVAAPGVGNKQARNDPVCLLFQQYASSGCEETTVRLLCERKRFCFWSSGIGCTTSAVRIAAAALDLTTDTSVTLDAVFADCASAKTESQCT